jgi:hypothetical protein
MVFPHFNSTFYGMVQMRFDLDIHCLGKIREGGERKGKRARMWRVWHYMVKVKSKSSIFAVRAQEVKRIVQFKIFNNTCRGFKMKQTTTTKKILV